MDTKRIPPDGDPFTAVDHDPPHVCNSGWVTISQLVVNDEGEEVEESALYLCRRCAEEAT